MSQRTTNKKQQKSKNSGPQSRAMVPRQPRMIAYGRNQTVQQMQQRLANVKQNAATRLAKANPGQNTRLKLSVLADPNAFASIAASFVIYGLSQGYDKSKAGSAYMAAQVLLFNAMANGVEVLLKAPRLWWQVTNAVRPKIARYRGVEIGFEFNMDTFGINTSPVINGAIFGAPLNAYTDGLQNISSATLTIPSLMTAADDLSDLFNFFEKKHPLIDKVNDFIYDPSAFAWRSSLFVATNPNDPTQSVYSANNLEVPITSWFGYLGLAANTYDDATQRVPTNTLYSQGGAGNHVGLRLVFPSFISKRHVKTGLNLKPVDLQNWVGQDTIARAAAALNNVNAVRPDTGFGLLPQAYGTTNATGIQPNLAYIYRIFNYVANMLSGAAVWFGASQTLVAMAVGTNCLDPFQTSGLTEAFFSVASSRQLSPVYNKVTNQVTVPFPAISDEALPAFWSSYETSPNIYYPNITGTPQYGGVTLDLCNSQIGSVYVAWAFQGLKDAKQDVKTADAEVQNMIPTSSPLGLFTQPSTMNMLTTKNLNIGATNEALEICGTTMETLLGKIAKKMKHDPIQFMATRKKNVEILRQSKLKNEKQLALELKRNELEFDDGPRYQNEFARRAVFLRAPSRTSPDTTTATILSITSEDQLDPNHAIENMMQMPVSAYSPVVRATDIERIVNGGVTAYEPGVMGSQSFTLESIGTAPTFVKDPVSMQASEATGELLRLSRGIAQTANLGVQFESVVNAVGGAMPMVRAGATVVGALVNVGKNIANRVRARRARRKAQK